MVQHRVIAALLCTLLAVAWLSGCKDFQCPEGTTRQGSDNSRQQYCQTPDRVRHGPYRELHGPEGTLHESGGYVRGKQHGLWTTYFQDGSISSQGTWHEGKMVGVHNQWNAGGTLVGRTTITADGHMVEQWYDNGQKRSEATVAGKAVIVRKWTETGELVPQPERRDPKTPRNPNLERLPEAAPSTPLSPLERLDRVMKQAAPTTVQPAATEVN